MSDLRQAILTAVARAEVVDREAFERGRTAGAKLACERSLHALKSKRVTVDDIDAEIERMVADRLIIGFVGPEASPKGGTSTGRGLLFRVDVEGLAHRVTVPGREKR